jgi:hypothetical protein
LRDDGYFRVGEEGVCPVVFTEDPTTDFVDDVIETTGFYVGVELSDDVRPIIDTTDVEIDVGFHIG